jgi:HSP20 family protein
MLLTRWTPRTQALTGLRDFDQVIDDVFGNWTNDTSLAQFQPRTDVRENEDGFVIEIELPGLRREEVKVEVNDNILTVTGERKREEERKTKGYHHMERYYGTFSRSFNLPGTANTQEVSASLKDGVLELRLPKRVEARTKLIDVK